MVRVHGMRTVYGQGTWGENSLCVRSVRCGQGIWDENSPCVRSVRGGQGTWGENSLWSGYMG